MSAEQTFIYKIKALFDGSEAKNALKDLQNSLTNLKLPKDLSNNLNRSLDSANRALDNYISKTDKGVRNLSDVKGIEKAFNEVTKEFQGLDKVIEKV